MKLFVFDFDGTLSDTSTDIATSVRLTQEHFGVSLMDKKEIIKHVGYGAKHLIEETVADFGVDIEEAFSYYKECYFEHCVDVSVPYDGVTNTLKAIVSRGDKACLFTNKPLKITMKSLEAFEIKDYFSGIFCPENLTKKKPDPEGILKSIELTGASLENTFMVGDSLPDILAARAAGVKVIGCLYGLGNKDDLEKADKTIKSIREII